MKPYPAPLQARDAVAADASLGRGCYPTLTYLYRADLALPPDEEAALRLRVSAAFLAAADFAPPPRLAARATPRNLRDVGLGFLAITLKSFLETPKTAIFEGFARS